MIKIPLMDVLARFHFSLGYQMSHSLPSLQPSFFCNLGGYLSDLTCSLGYLLAKTANTC